jgi:hypothetical protein
MRNRVKVGDPRETCSASVKRCESFMCVDEKVSCKESGAGCRVMPASIMDALVMRFGGTAGMVPVCV